MEARQYMTIHPGIPLAMPQRRGRVEASSHHPYSHSDNVRLAPLMARHLTRGANACASSRMNMMEPPIQKQKTPTSPQNSVWQRVWLTPPRPAAAGRISLIPHSSAENAGSTYEPPKSTGVTPRRDGDFHRDTTALAAHCGHPSHSRAGQSMRQTGSQSGRAWGWGHLTEREAVANPPALVFSTPSRKGGGR